MKLLLWLGLIVLVILALQKKLRGGRAGNAEGVSGAAQAAAKNESAAETMVCCAHCQVYIPASEAVCRGQKSYCSAAHADLH